MSQHLELNQSSLLNKLLKQCLQSPPLAGHDWTSYFYVLLLFGVALFIRLAIAPVNAGLQYVTFFPAVTLAAIIGGYRAGLFCTLLGLCSATYIFTPPYYSFSLVSLQNSAWSNLVFLIDGLVVSFSIDAMHKYRQKFEHELREATAIGESLNILNKQQETLIGELMQAQTELRIAAITFDSHDAIMITDAQTNIIRVNKAFERFTGYSRDEVIGQKPTLLKSGVQNQEFYEDMWATLLRDGVWRGELWDKHKAGALLPKSLTISAVKNHEGITCNYVGIFTDITERKRIEAEIYKLAFHDPLTGLHNRRALLEQMQRAQSTSARAQQYGALIFLDMDKFKTLNDTLGHDFGDLLLIEVAHRISACVRDVDTVARLGGDEFVVLIEGVGDSEEHALQKANAIAEKIHAELVASYQLQQYVYYSSPSIGVSLFFGKNETIHDLIKHADMAMYQAKEAGRNSIRFFDPSMQLTVESRASIEADLRNAIQGEQLRLYYQVQVDRQGNPIGAEALVCWAHPTKGLISPSQFIPVAEESTLILDIGQWVLETACKQLMLWQLQPEMKHLVISVNVNATQFKQADFVERIATLLQQFQIPPSRIKLELTESVSIENLKFVIAKMQQLKQELGISLSLDDFGTGYSSLSYLKQLPLDQIKIDQSFVRDMMKDDSDAVMVKTIIDLAHNFDLEVVAEGVETQQQFNMLKKNRCMAFQGYLFSRPVADVEFQYYVREKRTIVRNDVLEG